MKRTLSLILAVVMVALMIPFAAITSVAASDVLYSMDFTEWGAKNPNAVTEVNGTLTMPDGWESTPDNNADLYNSISDKGLFLGGAAQGFGMNYIPETNGAYVIKFQWQTEHKIGVLRFGFTQGDKPLSLYVNKGYEYMATMAFPYQAGPTNNNAMTANWGKYNNVATYETGGVVWHANERWGAGDMANGFKRTTEIYDKNGNAVDQLTARTNLAYPAVRGDLFTTYIFVGEDNIVDKVAMEVAGLRYEYMAPIDISANGRLGIWITNDGTTTSAYFKNVSYIDNSNDSFEYPAIGNSSTENAEVCYNYNFSEAKSLSDIPALELLDGENGNVSLRDGKLYIETEKDYTTQTVHADTALVLPNEYLPEDGNYTIEFVLDGSSYFNYLFAGWTNSDYTTGSISASEFFNLGSYYKDDVRGNNNKLFANKGLTNALGTSVSTADLPANMRDSREGNEIRVQLIVSNNLFRYAYVSVVTEEGVLYSHYGQTATAAISEGMHFALRFRNLGGYGASIGIKSITVLDDAYCDLDTTNYSAAGVQEIIAATTLTKGVATYRNEKVTVEDTEYTVEGIRFTTTVTEADFQTLVDLVDAGKVDSVEFGTLITTKAWADAAGAVTFEALNAKKGDKTAYVAVMATIGDFYDIDTFAGTICTTNTERTYVAVGFAKVTIGKTVLYVYSAENSATLASVQG